MVRLKVKHIDPAQKIIRIEQSKGRKDRNVMLSAETLDLLRQWWKARPSRKRSRTPMEERWLFSGNRARQANQAHQHQYVLDPSGLFHTKRADAAGIREGTDAGCRALRHSFATQLCWSTSTDIRDHAGAAGPQ